MGTECWCGDHVQNLPASAISEHGMKFIAEHFPTPSTPTMSFRGGSRGRGGIQSDRGRGGFSRGGGKFKSRHSEIVADG